MREIRFRAWDKDNSVMFTHAEASLMTFLSDRERFEIMQYTGLKDSYATEEYFGYIIEEDDGTRRVIEDGCSAVLFKNSKVKYDIKYFWQLEPHKVIGNIYENPELLKEAK